MLRNLSLSVLRYERVKTTEAKAKEVRVFVDRMVNLGKDGSLAARRRALAWLPERVIVEKVFNDLAARWPDRRGGSARVSPIKRPARAPAPRYGGFQVQPNSPTVQAELERALSTICDEAIRVIGAGRTDAGVHASGQVVDFRTTKTLGEAELGRGVNALLPDDITVSALEP